MPPKGKKSKKPKEPKVSYYQAITSYKITIKEQELKDANSELEKAIETNKNLKQRNERLYETKLNNMEKAVNDYKSYAKEYTGKYDCDKEDVLKELKNLWNYKQSQEREMLSIRKDIKRTEREIVETKRQLKEWKEFKNTVQYQLGTQIELLRKELGYMNENYEIISNSIKNNLASSIEKIRLNTEEYIQKKNIAAAQKAFSHIDKNAIEMSKENKWMTQQIELYKEEVKKTEQTASNLEQENIDLMAYLFECNNEEVNYVRSFFEKQFLDDDNLEENSIMRVDLNDLDSVRPENILGLSMKKLKEIEMRTPRSDNRSLAQSNRDGFGDESEGDGDGQAICLYGHKKELIRQKTPSEEEMKAEMHQPNISNWPITQEMLQDILTS